MQRRTVAAASSLSIGGGATVPTSTAGRGGRSVTNAAQQRSQHTISTLVLVVIAVGLTVASYILPDHQHHPNRLEQQMLQTEQRVLDSAMETERSLEHEFQGLFGGGGATNAASARMQQQSSQWVDGEKKLKRELQKLAVLQSQGQELGVPVATRWLGDDIPAYAGTGVDVTEWKHKVEQRYTEMRAQEQEWQRLVAATLDVRRG